MHVAWYIYTHIRIIRSVVISIYDHFIIILITTLLDIIILIATLLDVIILIATLLDIIILIIITTLLDL